MAQDIINKADTHAGELGVKVCISIVDAGGHLKAFHRMDGGSIGPVDVCLRKARTSALFGIDSGDFGELVIKQHLLGMEQTNGGLATFPGGLPIIQDGSLVGAIGVSGASAEQYRQIAGAALA